LLVQNISNQTKRHPTAPALRASLDFPGEAGGRAKLGLWPQTNAADGPRFTRKTEAVQKGDLGFVGDSRRYSPSPQPSPRWGEGVIVPSLSRGRSGWGWGGFSVPLVRRRVAQPSRGISARTVSAQREFRSSPAWRATQETRSVAEGGGQGRLSLVPFFGRSKKGTICRLPRP